MRTRPSTYLVLSTWYAIFAGLGEVFILAIQRYVLNRFINVGADAIWMVPVINIVVYAIPGLFLYLVSKFWPKLVTIPLANFIYAFVGFYTLLIMIFSHITVLAIIPVAIGLATQVARYITSHPYRYYTFFRTTIGCRNGIEDHDNIYGNENGSEKKHGFLCTNRRIVIWAGIIITFLWLGVLGSQELVERRSVAALPQVSPDAPNVLLVVLDTVRAQSLSLQNYERLTSPQLEKIAKNAVTFERAYSTSPWTLPAHGSLFTGRYPKELSADFETPLDDTFPTLAEELSAHGYVTAGFVANTAYCSYESGLNRGFVIYEDYSASLGQALRSSTLGRMVAHSKLRRMLGYYDDLGRKNAEQVNREFLGWLNHYDDKRPFFVFLNYFDAHDPYLPPEEFWSLFSPTQPRGHLSKWGQGLSNEDIQELNDAYDGSIAYLDYQVGLLYDELHERGLLENTILVIMSDHGEQFGEHGLMSHANSLYHPLLHVPLLISMPGQIPSNLRIPHPVTIRDIPGTVIDLVGLESTMMFPGTSLRGYWESMGDTSRVRDDFIFSDARPGVGQPDWYPSSKGEMQSLIFNWMHYILNGDGSEEIYDIESDPAEEYNLAGSAESIQMLELLRKHLNSMLTSTSN